MVLSRLAILLDNPLAVYFPGQTVSGKVFIDITEKPKILQGIAYSL